VIAFILACEIFLSPKTQLAGACVFIFSPRDSNWAQAWGRLHYPRNVVQQSLCSGWIIFTLNWAISERVFTLFMAKRGWKKIYFFSF
jgi:hypothetical protein